MPAIFQKICSMNGRQVDVTMLAQGGKSFAYHVDQPETRFNILYGNYDLIVLQDRQKDYDAKDSMEYGMALDGFISQTSARKVLYMTWVIEPERALQEYVADGYKALGEAIHADVAPVGTAFWSYKDTHPNKEDELFAPDGRHATPLGSTLAAYTLYETVFGYPYEMISPEHGEMCSLIHEIIRQF